LSGDQKAKLGSDRVADSPRDRKARRLVDYLRGLELPEFRSRSVPLGDIVHSAPVLAGQTLFVGANDGMLHAFDARTGDERFAYVPNLVFGHLKDLGAPDYVDHHRYYVDGTPYVGEVTEDIYQRGTYLVGGLGKGGRGYYGLKIGSRRRIALGVRFGPYKESFTIDDWGADVGEREISGIVRWEYPPPDSGGKDGAGSANGAATDADPDMGYSFGQGYVVNANAPEGTYRPVVIFGNGYNSPGGRAVLYILDAAGGALIRKIDTGAGGDNGLSIPALVDVNMDQLVDFVYAGDLKGNLWKFDLRAEDPRDWGVFHGDDMNGDGVIDAADGDVPRPLFQASGQPITGRPDVMAMYNGCLSGATGYMVVFGTGKFLGASDRFDTSVQSIYGIWDVGEADAALGHLTQRSSGRLSSGLFLARREVVEFIVQDEVVMRRLSDWVAHHPHAGERADEGTSPLGDGDEVSAGWFFDFPGEDDPHGDPGERVTGSVAIRGGMAIVISFLPSPEPDKRADVSWVNILNICAGGGVAAADQSDLLRLSRRYEGRLNAIPAFVKTTPLSRMDRIVITDGAGRLVQMPFFGETWGRAFWRHE
jgi:type IV pilus assembly protein PilY1